MIQRNAGFGARRGAARSTSTPWVRPTTWETHSRPRRLRGASGERLRGAPPRVTTRASREFGSGWRRAAGELNKRAEPSARARAPRPRAEPLLPPRRPAELLPGEARPAGARTARARRRRPTGAGAPPSRGYARRCSRPSVALARPRSGRPTPPPQGAGCGGAPSTVRGAAVLRAGRVRRPSESFERVTNGCRCLGRIPACMCV